VTAGGWGRRCCIAPGSSGREVVHAESDFCTMAEAVLLVRLPPEVPYVLLPSTADPGEECDLKGWWTEARSCSLCVCNAL
jgi:hypothetical protein